jgi:hypothetical protein
LQNDTPNYVTLIEPPDADPHVRWCERERLAAAPYSISVLMNLCSEGVISNRAEEVRGIASGTGHK